jgi:hypothetical protein
MVVLFGKEFDADERSEVGRGLRGFEFDDIRSTAAELLEDRDCIPEDGDPKGLPIGDRQAGGVNGIAHDQGAM